MLSLTDLFQSCASTSLSNDFWEGSSQEPSATAEEFDVDDFDDLEYDNDWDDFEKLNFTASGLYRASHKKFSPSTTTLDTNFA